MLNVGMPARTSIDEVRLIGPEELRLLDEPLREGIVHGCTRQARTATALAAELGVPVTRLYYHLDLLLKRDLLRVERTRLVNGIRERHYRACARQLRLDRSQFAALRAGDPALESVLGHTLDRARTDIAAAAGTGRVDLSLPETDPRGLVAWRMVLALTPAERKRWAQRLRRIYDELEQLAQRSSDGAGERQLYSVTFAMNPTDPET